MNSKKIVKKKKINAICVIGLLLSVIFIMTSCPNGVNVDKGNEQESPSPSPTPKKLFFSAESIDGADISGITLYVNGNKVAGNNYEILLTELPEDKKMSFRVVLKNRFATIVDRWEGVDSSLVSVDKLTATLTISDISKSINIKMFIRKITSEDISEAVKFTKNKLYVDKNDLKDLTKTHVIGACVPEKGKQIYPVGSYVNGFISSDTVAKIFYNIDEILKDWKDIDDGADNVTITIPPFEGIDSIKKFLDWKWDNAKNESIPDFFSNEISPWLTFTPINSQGLKKACRPGGGDLYIALRDVDENPNVYFRPATDNFVYINFEVTFIEKKENPSIYSFPFGTYVIGKESGETPFPPADSNGNSDYETVNLVHMFRLSYLVWVSLEKQLKDNALDDLAEAQKYVDANFNGNGLDLGNLSKWDVYISYGRTTDPIDHSSSACFRNVLKFNDSEFWKKCWE